MIKVFIKLSIATFFASSAYAYDFCASLEGVKDQATLKTKIQKLISLQTKNLNLNNNRYVTARKLNQCSPIANSKGLFLAFAGTGAFNPREIEQAIKIANISDYGHNQFFYDDKAQYSFSNCYEDQSESSVDLVLCNPPFHQVHTIGDFIAMEMFKNAKKVLKPGGSLVVIGNSHLAYQVKLKKIFGNSKITATNKKFMIINCLK